jgi:hypothetical protein
VIDLGPLRNSSEHPHRARAMDNALQGAFLAAIMEMPNVSLATKAAGIGRTTHYRWLKTDDNYRELFEEAMAIGKQALKDAAVEGALEGWEEVTIERNAAGVETKRVVKKRSERLLELLLRGAFPQEYKNTIAHTGADGVSPVEVEVSAREQFLSTIAAIAARSGAVEES